MRNTAFGDGSIVVNSGGGGIYATFFTGGLSADREDLETFYLNGYVGGGYTSYGTRRDALAGNATGSTEGGQFNALAGGGYDFRFGSLTFGPIASFQYTDDGQVGRTNYDSHGVICSAHFDF